MKTERLTNVLLVDDDAVDVMNLQRAFSRNNIKNPLFVASSAQEALELLRSSDFSKSRLVVLLDINLPRMNGLEFLRLLRADETLCSTLVIILTTSNDERDRVAAYKLNVAGFLLKPETSANFVELAATMNKYWSLLEMP
ncbi:MAG TPA: response regulator [Polyangia bacterium]